MPEFTRQHHPYRRRAAAADLEAAAERIDAASIGSRPMTGERIIGRRVSPAWAANAVDDRHRSR